MISILAAAIFVQANKMTGLECFSVDKGGVLDQAHIRKGDVLLAFDGVPTPTREELRFAVWNCLRQGSVALTFRHGKIAIDASQLGEWPKSSNGLGARFVPVVPPKERLVRDRYLELVDAKKIRGSHSPY